MTPRGKSSPLPGAPAPRPERRINRPLREVLDELLSHTREIARRAKTMSAAELDYAQQRLEWLADEVWRVATGEAMFSYEPYGLMLRKDDGDFRRAVNRVLAGLYRGGAIKEVYMRWFGKIGEPTPLLAAMFILNALPE